MAIDQQSAETWVRSKLSADIGKVGELHEARRAFQNSGSTVITKGTVIKAGTGAPYEVESDVLPGAAGVMVHRAFSPTDKLCGPDDVYMSHEYIYDADGHCLGRGVQSAPVADVAARIAPHLPAMLAPGAKPNIRSLLPAEYAVLWDKLKAKGDIL